MPNTLYLRLEGPLQSWGERGRWSVRDTASEPTKSGVVGLLACALGLHEDADLRRLSRKLRLGVRCDRPGARLIDYHTIVGGVMSAEGRVKVNASTRRPETVVSWRHYLCDASFLAAVQSDEPDLIDRLAQAVQSPCWPLYLGRRSCPPSRPVYAGVADHTSLESALAAKPILSDSRESIGVRAVLETSPAAGVRRRDEIDSRSRRTYLPRYTFETMLAVPTETEAE